MQEQVCAAFREIAGLASRALQALCSFAKVFVMPASYRGLRNQSSAFATRAHVTRRIMGLSASSSVLCCGEQPMAAMIEPLHSISAGILFLYF
jgi:hypothetical protein